MDELLIFDCDGVVVDRERLSHGVLQQMRAALRTPYCVAANGNRNKVEFTLGHTGLLPRLAGRIFSADDVQYPKPAPDPFLHSARSLGAAPRRTIVGPPRCQVSPTPRSFTGCVRRD